MTDQLKNARKTLKEIGGLLGAVDGKYIERCRKLIQEYHKECYKKEQLLFIVLTLIEKLEENEKEFYKKKLKKILDV